MKQLRAWLTTTLKILPGTFAMVLSHRNRPLLIGDHETLSWREVADFRERLKRISRGSALEVLRILRRNLDEIRRRRDKR